MLGRRVTVIAHRGAVTEAPENTLKSFQRAIEMGADYVEFDVHFAKDGEIVVIHDEALKRTTGRPGKVHDFTASQLAEMDAGEGEHIPTLEEVIKLCNGQIKLQIEIKVKGIAQALISQLKNYEILENVLISSFIHRELDAVKKIDFRIPCATLDPTGSSWVTAWFGAKNVILNAMGRHMDGTHPYYKILNREFVRRAHAAGLFVNPWTINDPKIMPRLLDL